MTYSIEIEGLSKQYRLGELVSGQQLRESVASLALRLMGRKQGRREEAIWALEDVCLRVEEGEVVGIIGRNGAGKSTLLKVLSRITHPTLGTIRMRGRVASLLEVGTGFHQELTGRENVYLNGSVLGMRKREVDRKFDSIVEFSGVEQFLDTPIKRYSSGMRLRLGFAVAAHLDPDTLIVDEVLAVGDVEFQKKCLDAMDDLQSGGRTVLFVSHNMAAVENLCTRGVWLDNGRVVRDGPAKDVISAYLESFAGQCGTGDDLSLVEDRVGDGRARFTSVEFLSPEGISTSVVRSGDAVRLRFHFDAFETLNDLSVGFRLYSDMGTLITETATSRHQLRIKDLGAGHHFAEISIDKLTLVPGRYSLSLWMTGSRGQPVYDGDVRVTLDVAASDVYGSGRALSAKDGLVYFPQRWSLPT